MAFGCRPGPHRAAAQSPAFPERGAVTDLDRYASAIFVHLDPERIRFVESDRIVRLIVRSENVRRFTRREHTTADVALRTRMISGPKNFFERLRPIPHRLIIHLQDYMLNDRWSDAFVGQGKMNRPIAAVEFKDWPHGRAHLLALHVGGVTGNTHSHESNEGRYDRFVSGCRAGLLLLRHGADHIAEGLSVNQSGS
jgi:hypothetical protein